MGIPISTDMDNRQRYNFSCSLPKGLGGAASELMNVYGSIIGRGTSFRFTGDLAGKTLIITDSKATTVTPKTITFTRSMFADNQQPTLAEIVAAINAAVAEATPTVASAGAKGNLVITGAGAAAATGVLTIGAGTANLLLGFPEDGAVLRVDNAVGVSLILPATWDNQVLYSRTPEVHAWDLTPTTLVKTRKSLNPVEATWTPSTRTLLLVDATLTAGVSRAVAFTVEF